jgi:ferredoxin
LVRITISNYTTIYGKFKSFLSLNLSFAGKKSVGGETYKQKKYWGGAIFMAYFITDRCTRVGACLPVCPVEAISEGDPVYVIDPDKCIECGACAAVCPENAIDPPK